MSVAAIAFTLLFVADDPTQPSAVIDVIEDDGGRRVEAVVVCGADPACKNDLSMSLAEKGKAEGSRALRTWPLLPRGAGLTPAVDGFVFTLDDVGPWQQPPPSAPESAKSAPSTSKKTPALAPVPDLPVLGDRGLRIFVPVVVDGAATTAVLYGDHWTVRGTAVVFLTRPTVPGPGALALSVAVVDGVVEADAGAAVVTAEETGGCAPIARAVAQRLTTSTAQAVTCAGPVAVSRLAGTRPPPSTKTPSKKTPKPADLPTWGVIVRPSR